MTRPIAERREGCGLLPCPQEREREWRDWRENEPRSDHIPHIYHANRWREKRGSKTISLRTGRRAVHSRQPESCISKGGQTAAWYLRSREREKAESAPQILERGSHEWRVTRAGSLQEHTPGRGKERKPCGDPFSHPHAFSLLFFFAHLKSGRSARGAGVRC